VAKREKANRINRRGSQKKRKDKTKYKQKNEELREINTGRKEISVSSRKAEQTSLYRYNNYWEEIKLQQE